jgi:hypothetical protein
LLSVFTRLDDYDISPLSCELIAHHQSNSWNEYIGIDGAEGTLHIFRSLGISIAFSYVMQAVIVADDLSSYRYQQEDKLLNLHYSNFQSTLDKFNYGEYREIQLI